MLPAGGRQATCRRLAAIAGECAGSGDFSFQPLGDQRRDDGLQHVHGPALGCLARTGLHFALRDAEHGRDAGDIDGVQRGAIQRAQRHGRQVWRPFAQRWQGGPEGCRRAQVVGEFDDAGAGVANDVARAGRAVDPVDRVAVQRLGQQPGLAARDHESGRDDAGDQSAQYGCFVLLHEAPIEK